MSIYATLWELHVPPDDGWCYGNEGAGSDGCRCVDVYAQAVPAHIDYTGSMWDGWLPPPVEDRDGNFRAVFICGPSTTKGTERCGQEYVNPLVVLTGDEYEEVGWRVLLHRIFDALEAGMERERANAELDHLQQLLLTQEQAGL